MQKKILGLLLAVTVAMLFMGCSNTATDTSKSDSDNANLSALTVSTGTLSPAFEAGTTAYAVSVPNATTSITVTGTVADATATLNATSGSVQSLNVGANTINIVVTAQDGSTVKIYVVTVTRAVSGAALSDITISTGTLSPSFATETMEYSVTVPNATTSITVTGTKYDTNATVSAPMTLNSLVVGVPQVATITVTSQDGLTVKNYVITVFRASYTSSNIGNLMLVPAGTFYNGTANMMQTAFRMSQHDITQSQYTTVTGAANPSFFPQVTNRPVENVTWYDAVEFCNKLSAMEGLTSVYTITMRSPATGYPITRATVTADFAQNGYRLPTEMQWMWAAMGATSDAITSDLSGGINTEGYLKGYAGSSEPAGGIVHMSKYAWYSPYSGSVPHTVGTKRANELGIYDMSGNVWQWCWDWFSDSYPGVKTDYLGAASGTSRVMRGGSWFDNVYYCSVARRGREDPNYQDGGVGFRVVRP